MTAQDVVEKSTLTDPKLIALDVSVEINHCFGREMGETEEPTFEEAVQKLADVSRSRFGVNLDYDQARDLILNEYKEGNLRDDPYSTISDRIESAVDQL